MRGACEVLWFSPRRGLTSWFDAANTPYAQSVRHCIIYFRGWHLHTRNVRATKPTGARSLGCRLSDRCNGAVHTGSHQRRCSIGRDAGECPPPSLHPRCSQYHTSGECCRVQGKVSFQGQRPLYSARMAPSRRARTLPSADRSFGGFFSSASSGTTRGLTLRPAAMCHAVVAGGGGGGGYGR